VELMSFRKTGKILSRIIAILSLGVLGCLAIGWSDGGLLSASGAPRLHSAAQTQPWPGRKIGRRAVLADYGRLPLGFEPNVGQTDGQVRFLARGHGYGIFLTSQGAVLALRNGDPRHDSAFRLRMLGANPAPAASGDALQPGQSNYIVGKNPHDWRTGVPRYSRVRFQNVYPGIDLVYYGTQQDLEYDLVVSPGADVSQIRFRLHGPSDESLRRNGDLVLRTRSGELVLHRPKVYQQTSSGRAMVPAAYRIHAGNVIAFEVGAYDPRRALVIDPQLSYSTYLGGTGDETAPVVAVDSSLSAYIAGTTSSTDFPTQGPQQAHLSGTSNIFVSKLNPAGTALLYSTYLGGSGIDQAAGIAVDAAFNAYIAGTTTSGNFPTLHAFQATPKTAGVQHAFVVQLKPLGGLAYGTYLSGSNTDVAAGLAVYPTTGGLCYVAGRTRSMDFPTTPGVLQPSLGAGVTSAFFAAKLNTTATGNGSLVYSTYLAGTQPAGASVSGGGIAVDAVGNAVVTGGTTFTNFPVVNAFRATPAGGVEAFVIKLNKTATSPPLYSTYIGGTGDDAGNAIAADAAGNAYITGSTTSSDYPVFGAAGTSILQSTNAGGSDAFITKFAAGGTLVYSTYLGGSGFESGNAIAVDPVQFAYVAGTTQSANFHTVNAPFAAFGGGASDAFLAKFAPSGNAEFSTYLGGGGDDRGTGVAADVASQPYVVGDTRSGNFPVTSGAFRASAVGGSDAFVSKFTGTADLALSVIAAPTPIGLGNPATFTFTITNNGPEEASGVRLSDTLPASGATFVAASAGQGSCAAPAGTPVTVVCDMGAIAAGGSATVGVQLTPTGGATLSNGATLTSITVDPVPANNAVSGSVPVSDYAIAAAPPTATVAAGQAASYTVTVSPVPTGAGFINPVSLTCSAGLPQGVNCRFSTNPVVPNGTPVTSSLTVTTVARPVTTAATMPLGLRLYPMLLPVGGFAFVLVGSRRRRRMVVLATFSVALGAFMLQAGCGSSHKVTPATGGTPAGTYTLTVAATSGSATRTTRVTLNVQ
jgi:uncharacterized repeat protein (TIGR01451 family)